MEMIPVSSSTMSAVGYDYETATLRIQFTSSATYDYYGVPAYVYEGLMTAASKGVYFSTYIRNVGYPFARV